MVNFSCSLNNLEIFSSKEDKALKNTNEIDAPKSFRVKDELKNH